MPQLSLRQYATELKDQAINIFKYGYGYGGRSMAMFMYNIIDLNAEIIDWKNIKPKPFKMETKENLMFDATYGVKVTRQEINVRDQVLTVTAHSVGSITCSCVGPVAYKRGQWFWNPQRQESYQLDTDVAVTGSGATTITFSVVDIFNVDNWDNLRMSGFSKAYGTTDSNTFNADQLNTLENYFTRANMSIILDQNEVNTLRQFKGNNKTYLVQKVQEASRKMLINMWRSIYTGVKWVNSIGGASSLTAGGLDWFLRNESAIPGANYGTGTGAGVGEININGASIPAKRNAFQDAVTNVFMSPLPNIKWTNKIIFFCTTTFMREIEELFYDKLIMINNLEKMELSVKTISFIGGQITFIVDEVLDDLNRYEKVAASGVYDIKKIGYFVPIDYCKLVFLANDVVTKDGLSTMALGVGKYFIPPQTIPELFEIQLYTSYSVVMWAIRSGSYRKVNLQW